MRATKILVIEFVKLCCNNKPNRIKPKSGSRIPLEGIVDLTQDRTFRSQVVCSKAVDSADRDRCSRTSKNTLRSPGQNSFQ